MGTPTTRAHRKPSPCGGWSRAPRCTSDEGGVRPGRRYEDAKGECGLDDYQGRRWDGLHRHLALTWLAYTFLVLQRLAVTTPPDDPGAPSAPGFPPLGGRAD